VIAFSEIRCIVICIHAIKYVCILKIIYALNLTTFFTNTILSHNVNIFRKYFIREFLFTAQTFPQIKKPDILKPQEISQHDYLPATQMFLQTGHVLLSLIEVDLGHSIFWVQTTIISLPEWTIPIYRSLS
jgi:hypothetical protein